MGIRRAAILGVVSIAAIFAGCHWYYFRELRLVTASLNSIPGVQVQSAWGTEDLRLSHIWASIIVPGNRRVMLYGLSRSSFEKGGGFCLSQLDGYTIRYSGFGNFWGSTVPPGVASNNCIWLGGEDADVPQLFPAIRTVQDLVRSVRDVERILAQWPRCPEYLPITTQKGQYHLCTALDASSNEYPPAVHSRDVSRYMRQ